jgi:S-formylglutathione hydrolase
MASFVVLKEHRCFDGWVRFAEHDSHQTKTKMKFSYFIPDGEIRGAIIWLSGLTCTEENFMTKAGAQSFLSRAGAIVICPDTSPRGLSLPGEHDHWDFGAGAGFYVDAVTDGYSDHYRMYSYVAKELYDLVVNEFSVAENISIMGHSMGGHGALVVGLREAAKFKSISAFAPIVNPLSCPWGEKAFKGYFGSGAGSLGRQYDACELIKSGHCHQQPLLIDQGVSDQFLESQLRPERLVQAAQGTKQKVILNLRQGYDHSYYFIASFVEQHVKFHSSHWTR